MKRIVALLLLAAPASAQFYSLATPFDGSSVYFATSLRLKGTFEPLSGKVFRADETGVRPVVSRQLRKPAFRGGNCFLGELYSFSTVELSADGKTLAAPGFRWTAGECHGAGAATLLRSASGTREISGVLRLSANGRWAIVDTTSTVFTQTSASILDLTTGARTDFQMPSFGGVQFPAGRAIADDGTAVFNYGGRTYIVRPGGTPQPFPNGYPLAISATGTRVLYLTDAVHLIDLSTGKDELLGAVSQGFPSGGLSDDGSRAAFVQNQHLYVADFGGGGTRQVSAVPEGLASAILSGNGKVAYAVTTAGRLLNIAVDTGVATEVVGRTADISFTGGSVDAGMFTTIAGHGFSDQSYSASAPLPLTLGGVTVTLDGRLLPISRVTASAIDVLIPWDIASSAPQSIVVDAPVAQSPFEAPQANLQVMSGVRAGALYQQNWTLVQNLTVHTGDVIHVFAVGLGAVTPEVPAGAAAPSTEPLSRLASPMSCTNASVLYAGLQPGTVARVYQVDLQIGTKTGYQQFSCSIGGGPAFAFLTLNVVPNL
jgi:uncharacterized protein (TIGR03437 family)